MSGSALLWRAGKRVAEIAGAVGALTTCLGLRTPAWSDPIELNLLSVAGDPVTVDDLPRRWLFIYFGYMYCPDLCPAALLDMVTILADLGNLAERLQPVFITIDPERDTGPALSAYVASFSTSIIALTGSNEQIQAAAREFDVHVVRYQDSGLAGYSIDHTSSFFLVDPERRRIADFPAELAPEEIALSLRALLDPPAAAAPHR